MLYLGCLAFFFFFLGDLNDLKFHSKSLVFSFPAGFLLLTVASALQINTDHAYISSSLWRVLFWVLFAFFMFLEIYTLFFTFPARSAYAAPGEKRPVCRTGVYALSRHPGVIWLFPAFLCLFFCAGFPAAAVTAYTLLDVALVIFEDICVFPSLLEGYDAYKKDTPFLIPTLRSIRNALSKKEYCE